MSTINCSITNSRGLPYSARITFVPLSSPQAEGAILITAKMQTLRTGTDGQGTIVLEQGDYKVLVEDDEPIWINVPNDAETYNLTDRIIDGAIVDQDTDKILTATALQFWVADTGRYHTLKLVLEDGEVVAAIEQ